MSCWDGEALTDDANGTSRDTATVVEESQSIVFPPTMKKNETSTRTASTFLVDDTSAAVSATKRKAQEQEQGKAVAEENKLKAKASIWLSCLFLFYLSLYIHLWSSFHQHREDSIVRHAARIEPDAVEPGRTASAISTDMLSTSNASVVETGIYIDRITDVSIVDSSWIADFYLWFRWTDATINPGQTFHVIDGNLESKQDLEFEEKDGVFYSQHRVEAKFTKFFNVYRFPRDNHLMTLRIEDSKMDHHDLVYVADVDSSRVSSRVKIPGYAIVKIWAVSKLHGYKSHRGNPWADTSVQRNFSQFIGALAIERPDWGLFLLMFQGVFTAVVIAMLAMMVSPHNDARYDLGIGAVFTVVAATYITMTHIPLTGSFTLADVVTAMSLMTVFLTLCQTYVARQWCTELDPVTGEKVVKNRWLDFIALAIFVVGYSAVVVGCATAASIQ